MTIRVGATTGGPRMKVVLVAAAVAAVLGAAGSGSAMAASADDQGVGCIMDEDCG